MDVVIIREAVREMDGVLQVAFFVRSPEGVVPQDRLVQVVNEERSELANAVSDPLCICKAVHCTESECIVNPQC